MHSLAHAGHEHTTDLSNTQLLAIVVLIVVLVLVSFFAGRMLSKRRNKSKK